MKLTQRLDLPRVTLVVLMAVAAVGCGGGGGGSESVQAPSQPGGASNTAPTIQGQPASSIAVGQQYIFQPTAADADGDSLTFTSSNLPTGASLNATSGRLTWTPTGSQVGMHSNIEIRVSDGRATATLSTFSITVTDVVNGSAMISWTAPTQNTDGSSLTDLAGYEIRYGRDSGSLDRSVVLSTPGLTSYLVENLSTGTWFFSVAARNAQGIASTPSDVASKVIS